MEDWGSSAWVHESHIDTAIESVRLPRYLQQEEVVEYRRIFKHTTERKGQSISRLVKQSVFDVCHFMLLSNTKVIRKTEPHIPMLWSDMSDTSEDSSDDYALGH